MYEGQAKGICGVRSQGSGYPCGGRVEDDDQEGHRGSWDAGNPLCLDQDAGSMGVFIL